MGIAHHQPTTLIVYHNALLKVTLKEVIFMAKAKYKRRSDGRKEATIRIDGKRIHVYGYTDLEIDLQKEELIKASHDGTLYVDKVTTFREWSGKWLELTRPKTK